MAPTCPRIFSMKSAFRSRVSAGRIITTHSLCSNANKSLFERSLLQMSDLNTSAPQNNSPAEGTSSAASNPSANPPAAGTPAAGPSLDVALHYAFMLGWAIVELSSRIKMATAEPEKSGLQLSSVWRATFYKIAGMQDKTFPAGPTASTLYELHPQV